MSLLRLRDLVARLLPEWQERLAASGFAAAEEVRFRLEINDQACEVACTGTQLALVPPDDERLSGTLLPRALFWQALLGQRSQRELRRLITTWAGGEAHVEPQVLALLGAVFMEAEDFGYWATDHF